jgi:hypothetical protein
VGKQFGDRTPGFSAQIVLPFQLPMVASSLMLKVLRQISWRQSEQQVGHPDNLEWAEKEENYLVDMFQIFDVIFEEVPPIGNSVKRNPVRCTKLSTKLVNELHSTVLPRKKIS